MSDTSHSTMSQSAMTGRRAADTPLSADTRGQTGWVGWIVFGAIMLMMVGAFHVIQGFVALFRDQIFVVGQSGLVVDVDYTAWGWTHIIGGAILVLVGACLMAGQMWARIVAVIVAVLSAIVNVAFIPAYPVWSVMMVGIDVLVIWAVTVHGSEIK
ncbi:MAG: hypothetical protein ABW075_13505 [Aeromicrobium sp.]